MMVVPGAIVRTSNSGKRPTSSSALRRRTASISWFVEIRFRINRPISSLSKSSVSTRSRNASWVSIITVDWRVGSGPHRGGARGVLQQADLAKILPALQLGDAHFALIHALEHID